MRVLRDLVGQSLSGRYRLIARLAGGGMGEVYRAHDLLLDRPVAVKVMHPSLASDPALVERFKAEARAAARLSHPNVVAVHDWGMEADDTYYMVMEYVSGSDLRDVLGSVGTVDPDVALSVVAAVCDALQAAHGVGLVHRDVKPENILIARDGTVKVADFGIAALAGVGRGDGGAILGTLRYLSPEQAGGGEAGAASDLWAAGAVLFELVTGLPPSNGASAESLRRRASDPPQAPSEVNHFVPAEVDEIVLRACAVQPDDRFGSAAEMAAALRSSGSPAGLHPARIGGLLRDLTGEVSPNDVAPTHLSPELRARRSRARVRRRVAFALLWVVPLAVFGVGRALGAFGGPQRVDVPQLVGLAKARATRVADESGLRLEIESRWPSRTVGRGAVLSQNPSGGRVSEGGVIVVTLSSGPPRVPVPVITGMTERVAAVRLRAAGMKAGKVSTEYSLEPRGTIIEQTPKDGRARWGSTIDYVVSRGPQTLQIPNVYGMRSRRAQKTLEAAGFVVKLVDSYSDEVPDGKVVSTDPAAASSTPEGTKISVYVSIGPEFEELTMPDLRGMSVSRAKAELERMGLRARVFESCPGTTVAETDPVAGTTVRENDVVALFVCG